MSRVEEVLLRRSGEQNRFGAYRVARLRERGEDGTYSTHATLQSLDEDPSEEFRKARREQIESGMNLLDTLATFQAWKDLPFACAVFISSIFLSLFLVQWNQEHVGRELMLDALPVSLLGVPVGFLLVFRSNNAHNTWYNGLGKVHSILSFAKNMSRLATVWMVSEEDLEQEVQRWVVAFLLAFRFSLREDEEFCREAMEQLLEDPREVDKVMSFQRLHRIYYCLHSIDILVKEHGRAQRISAQLVVEVEREIGRVFDIIEGCELIHKNPIPGSYLVHLRRILFIYMELLPFVLYKYVPPAAVLPVHMLLCFAVVGIEVAAAEIQEPFGNHPSDIPLDSLCIITLRDLIVMGNGYVEYDGLSVDLNDT